jgi:hypothetical protein
MLKRRGAIALSLAAMLSVSATAFAQKDKKKQDKAQKEEVQTVVKLVDGVSSGEQQPTNDLGLAWVRQDFLKAQGNKEYVPFIVTIDPSKAAPGSTLTYYWRVVQAGGAQTTDEGKDKKKNGKKDYPYEDVSFVPMTAAGAGPMQIARSFTVPAGSYDVYVVCKEAASKEKNASAPKVSVMKQSVDVPDFWNDQLNTSSVIIAQRIQPLSAPLTPEEQADRPYAFGSMEIVPATSMTFTKKQELSTFMLIYNPKTDSAGKPDVTVEYSFYAKQPAGEKFFNKTNPQNLNAQTLPPQFDLAAGHQLQSGQAVPLATFPEGEYRLEIKVTDKVANKSLTRDVNFTVAGS